MIALDDDRRHAGALALSGLVHAGLVALVLLGAVRMPDSADVPQVIPIEVSFVPEASSQATPAPARRPEQPPVAPPPQSNTLVLPPRAAPGSQPPLASLPPADAIPDASTTGEGWQHPAHMLSAARLSEPRNRPVARQIETMPGYLRTEQLCQFEAMEQIAAANPKLAPDQVAIAAMREPKVAGDLTEATGAAFRSHGRWYQLALRCRVAAGKPSVIAFEYRLGALIPKRDWSDLGLTAAGDD